MARLTPREVGVELEVLSAPLWLNGVQLSGRARLVHGDELRFGEATLLVQAQFPEVRPAPQVFPFDEWRRQLVLELARAGRRRQIGVVAIGARSLNVAARSALTRRVVEGTELARVVAYWGALSTDVLVGLLPEATEAQLASRQPPPAGRRAARRGGVGQVAPRWSGR